MSWRHRWHLLKSISLSSLHGFGLASMKIRTNVPGIEEGKDGANSKDVVELVQNHRAGDGGL